MNQALTFEEVKERGKLLRKLLVENIQAFEEETGLTVARIDLFYFDTTIGGARRTMDVKIEVPLSF